MYCICTKCITALHDTVLNITVIPDMYIIQNNRILDDTVITDINFFEKNGILYRTIDDASACDQAVADSCISIVFAGGKSSTLEYTSGC